jgi:hypothetical protein
MADGALAALRAAECAAAARRFNPDQSAEAVALANVLRSLFSKSTAAAATAELLVERQAPLLPQLPTELIIEVLQHLDVRSLGRLACICRQLYFGPPCPPRPMSLVETALRRRADEGGRCVPSSLPAGVSKWVPYLLQREWRSGIELRTVAAGRHRSFFVDANGALLFCDRVEEGEASMLGLRIGSSQTSFTAVLPTPVPAMAGVRFHAVFCHLHCTLVLSEAGQVFAWVTEFPLLDEDIDSAELQDPMPAIIEQLRSHRVRQVVTTGCHCAALTEDKALYMWDMQRVWTNTIDYPITQLGHGRLAVDMGAPLRVLAFESMHAHRLGSCW